jgi:hypothetical protein
MMCVLERRPGTSRFLPIHGNLEQISAPGAGRGGLAPERFLTFQLGGSETSGLPTIDQGMICFLERRPETSRFLPIHGRLEQISA